MEEVSSSSFGSSQSYNKSFVQQCSDIVIYFKELVQYGDTDASSSKMIEFERKFINLAEITSNELRVKTQGTGSLDPVTVSVALAELQQSCYNEVLQVYQAEQNHRMVGMLHAMKNISNLPVKNPDAGETEEHPDEPRKVDLRRSQNSNSLLSEAELIDTAALKENIKQPRWVLHQFTSRVGLISWVPKYNFTKFRGDLIAAIAVGLMIIPQGMAYALLAGLPPIYGLYTAWMPLFVYSIFGSSHELAIGPTAMVSLIIPTAVGATNDLSTDDYIEIVIFYAFCYGIVLFLLGLFKVGFLLENILSRPALSGFTQGATILIACSQLKNVFGYHPEHVIYTVDNLISGFVSALASHDPDHERHVSWYCAAMGLPAMVIILVMKKVKKTFPTIVLVLIAAIICIVIIDKKYPGGLDGLAYPIYIVKEVPAGLPRPKVIAFGRNELTSTIGALIVLVFIGFVETISVAKKFAAENQYSLSFNQELLALGVCNLVGPWFQAYPVAGSLPRTVVNAHTGAQSPLATFMAALIVTAMLLFGTGIIYYVPLCVLGAIVMSAALSIVDYSDVRYMWRIGQKLDAVQFIIVALCTAFFGPIIGVASAGLLSLVQVIYHSGRPYICELGRLPNTNIFKDTNRFSKAKLVDGVAIVSMHAPRLSFYNFPWFREGLEGIEEQHDTIPVQIVSQTPRIDAPPTGIVSLDDDPVDVAYKSAAEDGIVQNIPLHTVIIDCSPLDGIDATSVQYLREMVTSYHEKGRLLIFAHVKRSIQELMKVSGIVPTADAQKYFFTTIADAVEFALMNGAEEAKAAQEIALAKSHHGPAKAATHTNGKKIDKILPVSKLFSAEFSANEISLI